MLTEQKAKVIQKMQDYILKYIEKQLPNFINEIKGILHGYSSGEFLKSRPLFLTTMLDRNDKNVFDTNVKNMMDVIEKNVTIGVPSIYSEFLKRLAIVDFLFHHGPQLSEDLTLYRGEKIGFLNSKITLPSFDALFIPNQEVTLPGFLATSVDKNVAEKFRFDAETVGEKYSHAVLLTLKVPKGTPVWSFINYQGMHVNGEESEIVFPSCTKWKVERVDQLEDIVMVNSNRHLKQYNVTLSLVSIGQMDFAFGISQVDNTNSYDEIYKLDQNINILKTLLTSKFDVSNYEKILREGICYFISQSEILNSVATESSFLAQNELNKLRDSPSNPVVNLNLPQAPNAPNAPNEQSIKLEQILEKAKNYEKEQNATIALLKTQNVQNPTTTNVSLTKSYLVQTPQNVYSKVQTPVNSSSSTSILPASFEPKLNISTYIPKSNPSISQAMEGLRLQETVSPSPSYFSNSHNSKINVQRKKRTVIKRRTKKSSYKRSSRKRISNKRTTRKKSKKTSNRNRRISSKK